MPFPLHSIANKGQHEKRLNYQSYCYGNTGNKLTQPQLSRKLFQNSSSANYAKHIHKRISKKRLKSLLLISDCFIRVSTFSGIFRFEVF